MMTLQLIIIFFYQQQTFINFMLKKTNISNIKNYRPTWHYLHIFPDFLLILVLLQQNIIQLTAILENKNNLQITHPMHQQKRRTIQMSTSKKQKLTEQEDSGEVQPCYGQAHLISNTDETPIMNSKYKYKKKAIREQLLPKNNNRTDKQNTQMASNQNPTKTTNIIYSTVHGSSYEDVLKLCQKYRRENSQLRYQIRQLENSLNIIQSKQSIQNMLYHNNNHNNFAASENLAEDCKSYVSKEVEGMRNQEQEYRLYKENIYKYYKQEIRDVYKFVDYLYLSYQEYVRTHHSKFATLIESINQKGIRHFLAMSRTAKNAESLERFVSIVEKQLTPPKTQDQENKLYNSQHTNSYLRILNSQMELTQSFSQHEVKTLRKRIKQLTDTICILVKIQREQLRVIRQQAKGTSQHIMEQLKQCIQKNFNKITQNTTLNNTVRYKETSKVNSSAKNQTERNKSRHRNTEQKTKTSESIIQQKNRLSKKPEERIKQIPSAHISKRLSLGKSVGLSDINVSSNTRKPPHPKQKERYVHHTPKNESSEGKKYCQSLAQSKNKY